MAYFLQFCVTLQNKTKGSVTIVLRVVFMNNDISFD